MSHTLSKLTKRNGYAYNFLKIAREGQSLVAVVVDNNNLNQGATMKLFKGMKVGVFQVLSDMETGDPAVIAKKS